mgnify:CR=1 FL=1
MTCGADLAMTLPGASVRVTRSVPLIVNVRLRAGAGSPSRISSGDTIRKRSRSVNGERVFIGTDAGLDGGQRPSPCNPWIGNSTTSIDCPGCRSLIDPYSSPVASGASALRMFLCQATIQLCALRAIPAGKTEIVGTQVVFLHEGRQVRPAG